jgi:farnesyl-diphosphate farnesyltransferase
MNSVVSSNDILQVVSRSFALCIPLLEDNKTKEVENMYLLSRVADTIEDSSHSFDNKKSLMKKFFMTLFEDSHIDEFINELRNGIIDEHDKILTVRENYEMILNTFRSLENDVRDVSVGLLMEMSSGMLKFLEKEIKNFEDLNEYCYYVAGTVGLYMNKIIEIRDNVKLDPKKAISVGRYLQKTNIIKNFKKDYFEGRSFWPSRLFGDTDISSLCKGENIENAKNALKQMLDSALSEINDAFEYVASVPYCLEGYRKFLLLSTLMATENLRLMKDNMDVFLNDVGVKIQRTRMPDIFAMVNEAASSNEALWKFKSELAPVI